MNKLKSDPIAEIVDTDSIDLMAPRRIFMMYLKTDLLYYLYLLLCGKYHILMNYFTIAVAIYGCMLLI
jgi:hypothetical protein